MQNNLRSVERSELERNMQYKVVNRGRKGSSGDTSVN